MVVKEISEETLQKVKSLPRIDYNAFMELINQGQVVKLVKFKKPKTIFYDEESKVFLYLNPFHKELNRCGYFKGDEMVTLRELSNSLNNAFFDWNINKHIKKLRSFISIKHRVDFDKDYFINYNFDLSSSELVDYYEGQYHFHYYKKFYDSVIKENTQEEIDDLIFRIVDYRNNNKY